MTQLPVFFFFPSVMVNWGPEFFSFMKTTQCSSCLTLDVLLHLYVYDSTLHSSKAMESTEISITGRLDKENVVQIHHGVLMATLGRAWSSWTCPMGEGTLEEWLHVSE